MMPTYRLSQTLLSSRIRKLKHVSKFIQTIYSSILRHIRCILLTCAKSLEQHVDHAHPLNFIDLCKKPGTVCRPCASPIRTFKYCHIDKGHPMLLQRRENGKDGEWLLKKAERNWRTQFFFRACKIMDQHVRPWRIAISRSKLFITQ
ncbi:hypothetical protein PsorP6_013941 [Peronosclerospora sorghi]|uniref:Uncharacterized protein n=1 Tax=Peronosclerospora sorghi TaxID=230839 RepID=A0ACC0VHQ2_9STRA|nr:hypothetical protein PsorP6_013941 [Peronosclerospora sorghi]